MFNKGVEVTPHYIPQIKKKQKTLKIFIACLTASFTSFFGCWQYKGYMQDVYFIDRKSKKKIKEEIPGGSSIEFLYSQNYFARWLRPLICHFPYFSKLYGDMQKASTSRKKIVPFIEKYKIDASEFLEPVDSFSSFNDFFIRKLKPSARPIAEGDEIAILPADGRYLAFQNFQREDGIFVKGKKFSLEVLLGDAKLAHKYQEGSLLIGRLAPVDYHRFHFPTHCTPSETRLINGPLYSVSPIALNHNIQILAENKRVITLLQTHEFGTMIAIEVGATNVGSIHQTFEPHTSYAKGDEKGYFSFGSCLVFLFEPGRIQFDLDLLENTHAGLETYAHMGESLGRALSPL
jgi:phosphatidylserine decarboxylase